MQKRQVALPLRWLLHTFLFPAVLVITLLHFSVHSPWSQEHGPDWILHHGKIVTEEKEKGSIEPGKLADLVMLSDDILTCPEERIRSMDVLLTMVGGKIVYQKSEFLDASED
ncbi:MAG: amidohydrolase family protein [Deltaproteobacteria bacterium]|nr:amidohydrolase family protein [Deltaproteobacteria bacterium]